MSTRTEVEAPRRTVSRLRPVSVALTAAVLTALALIDAVLVELGWSLLVFLAVTALAVSSSFAARGAARRRLAVAAVLLSWAGTGVLALAAPIGMSSFGLVEATALLLLLVGECRRATGRRDWLRAGGVALAVVALPARFGGADSLTFLVLMAAVTAVAIAVAFALRAQDDARRLAVAAVRRSEREDIARELHDVVAHHVTGMVVATQAARTVAAASGSAAGVPAALASIEAAGGEALAAMRRLVAVLRTESPDTRGGDDPAPRQPTPTLADLPDLVRRFSDARPGSSVELRAAGDLRQYGAGLPAGAQASLYRVVQESLTNVARHAPGAPSVHVSVAAALDAVTVEVRNTRGAPEEQPATGPGGGYGLVGMAERVGAFHGTLRTGPDDDGWCVRASVPRVDPVQAEG